MVAGREGRSQLHGKAGCSRAVLEARPPLQTSQCCAFSPAGDHSPGSHRSASCGLPLPQLAASAVPRSASTTATLLGTSPHRSSCTPPSQADLADMILSGQASPAASFKSASPFAAAAAAAAAVPSGSMLSRRAPGVPAVQQFGFMGAGGLSPVGGGGSGALRQASAPLSIPSRSCSRVRSLHDLQPADLAGGGGEGGGGGSEQLSAAELQQQRLKLAPSSAPAATRGLLGQMLSNNKAHTSALATAGAASVGDLPLQQPSQQQQAQAAQGQASQQQMQLVRYGTSRPEAPANPFAVAYSAGGSSGGFLPASGSPQLPFAMTPAAGQSLTSLMAEQQRSAASLAAGAQQTLVPLPVISGRDISAMATIKRPSWSSR
jgi:hypothetical protein